MVKLNWDIIEFKFASDKTWKKQVKIDRLNWNECLNKNYPILTKRNWINFGGKMQRFSFAFILFQTLSLMDWQKIDQTEKKTLKVSTVIDWCPKLIWFIRLVKFDYNCTMSKWIHSFGRQNKGEWNARDSIRRRTNKSMFCRQRSIVIWRTVRERRATWSCVYPEFEQKSE